MTDREKLVEILRFGMDKYFLLNFEAEIFADLLISNGVTVQTKTEKPPTDLTGKCGSCAFSEPTVAFGGSKCYVLCVNKDIRGRGSKSKLSAVKQRTARACKRYVPKEGC